MTKTVANSLQTLCLIFSALSCRTPSTQRQADGINSSAAWEDIQAERNRVYDAFFSENAAAYEAFLNAPMGYQGMPAIIAELLADVMPEIWGPSNLASGTGFTKLVGAFPAAWHHGAAKEGPLTIVAFSCATCHAGRVKVGDEEKSLVGAPNNRIDTAGFRNKIWQTVNDPRFNVAEFVAAIDSKNPGWLFGSKDMAREAKEISIFKANGQQIIGSIRTKTNSSYKTLHQVLAPYTYRDDAALVSGGVPGSTDAFGFTIAGQLMPPEAEKLPPEQLESVQRALLPKAPPMIDIMSVWQQHRRKYAQWDGSIQAKLIRNIGAELGVIGSPAMVNLENAQRLTPFLADMPAPVYPFAVDLDKAARGQLIYQQACQHCHTAQRIIGIDQVGTDPNRAQSLTEKARAGLIMALKTACSDQTLEDCRASDDQILADRLTSPGYVALPHDGIWARAPYLHNGSIPTLYHLLVPAERPRTFERGNIGFDQEKIGFDWTSTGIEFSTSRPGFSNAGHANRDVFFGGRDFAADVSAREELLEYLKTL